MNLLRLAWKNLRFKPLNALLSILLFGLGIGLVSLLLLLQKQLTDNFEKNLAGVDLVVGAKGSPLQLILNAMYHMDAPTGNITLGEIRPFINPNHPLIDQAIAVSMGDNLEGYRIVGTTPDLLDWYGAEVSSGRVWSKNFEAVIGSVVAENLNLSIGSTFLSSHGLLEDDVLEETHEDQFTVVGILPNTGTVLDQLLLTTHQSYWHSHDHDHGDTPGAAEDDDHEDHDHDDHEGHDHAEGEHDHDDHEGHDHAEGEHDHDDHEGQDHAEGEHDHDDHEGHDHAEGEHDHDDHEGHDHAEGEHDHDDHAGHDHAGHDHGSEEARPLIEEADDAEVTSLLLKFKGTNYQSLNMARAINENTDLQAASPAIEINRLFSLFGTGERILRWLALVIIVVSGLSIFVSLYSSLRDRRYELAVMRTLGAGPGKLFSLILFEGILLAFCGFLLGMLLSHGGMQLFAAYAQENYRYSFSGLTLLREEYFLFAGALAIGALASILPAMQAARTDIADTLTER